MDALLHWPVIPQAHTELLVPSDHPVAFNLNSNPLQLDPAVTDPPKRIPRRTNSSRYSQWPKKMDRSL